MNPLKVVVMGYGHLGKWHAQKVSMCTEATLYAIVEPVESNKLVAQSTYPDTKVVSHIGEVIRECDVVFIVTPTSTHYSVLKEVLKFEKHIFCEKPLCALEAEAKEIVELAKLKPSIKIQVGHSERFHPLVAILKNLMDQSKDNTYCLEFIRVTSPKGRALDVHVTDDIMIHDVDLLLHVFKKSILSSYPIGFKMHSTNLDFVDVTLELQDGGKARLKSCREEVEEMRVIHFYHKMGHYKFDLMNYTWSSVDAGNIKLHSVQKRDHLLEEHKTFYSAIINNQTVAVSATEALENISFLSKIHQTLGIS